MTTEDGTIRVSRGGPDAIDAELRAIETYDSFDVFIDNDGPPGHVHCRLGGDLTRIASIATVNHYVEPGDEIAIPVRVGAVESAVEGTIEVSTGYGAEAVSVGVTVLPGGPPVAVDESLATPARNDTEDGFGERLGDRIGDRLSDLPGGGDRLATLTDSTDFDPATVGVVVLAVIALLVAAVAAAIVGGSAAMIGVLVVAAGLIVAGALLIR